MRRLIWLVVALVLLIASTPTAQSSLWAGRGIHVLASEPVTGADGSDVTAWILASDHSSETCVLLLTTPGDKVPVSLGVTTLPASECLNRRLSAGAK